jgi:hypothetical protein
LQHPAPSLGIFSHVDKALMNETLAISNTYVVCWRCPKITQSQKNYTSATSRDVRVTSAMRRIADIGGWPSDRNARAVCLLCKIFSAGNVESHFSDSNALSMPSEILPYFLVRRAC